MDALETCFFKSVNRHFNQCSYNAGTAGTGFTAHNNVTEAMDFSESIINTNKSMLTRQEVTGNNTIEPRYNVTEGPGACFATIQPNLLLNQYNGNRAFTEHIVTAAGYKNYNDFTRIKTDNVYAANSMIRLFEEQKDNAQNSADNYGFANDYLKGDNNNDFYLNTNTEGGMPDAFKEGVLNYNHTEGKCYYFTFPQRHNNYNFELTPRTCTGF